MPWPKLARTPLAGSHALAGRCFHSVQATSSGRHARTTNVGEAHRAFNSPCRSLDVMLFGRSMVRYAPVATPRIRRLVSAVRSQRLDAVSPWHARHVSAMSAGSGREALRQRDLDRKALPVADAKNAFSPRIRRPVATTRIFPRRFHRSKTNVTRSAWT